MSKIKKTLFSLLVKMLSGRARHLIKFGCALAVSAIAALLGKWGINLSDEQLLQLSGAVFFAVTLALDELVNRTNLKGVKGIQEILQSWDETVERDGWAGEITVAAAERLRNAARVAEEESLPVGKPAAPERRQVERDPETGAEIRKPEIHRPAPAPQERGSAAHRKPGGGTKHR